MMFIKLLMNEQKIALGGQKLPKKLPAAQEAQKSRCQLTPKFAWP